MMPIEILFMENHSEKFKLPKCHRFAISGILLRQIWLWSCILLTSAYLSIIKSVLIKEPERTFISTMHELMRSELPVIITIDVEVQYEYLKFSPYHFDQWLYENVHEVLFYSDQ